MAYTNTVTTWFNCTWVLATGAEDAEAQGGQWWDWPHVGLQFFSSPSLILVMFFQCFFAFN